METTPPQTSAQLSWRAGALWLTLPLLGLLTLIVARLALESGRRQELERPVEVTAVGDTVWYRVPKPEPGLPMPVAAWQGQSLLPVSYRPIDLRDSRLRLEGYDDEGRLRIYSTHDPVPPRNGEAERRTEPVLLIKIGPDQYLKVQPAGKAGQPKP